MKVYELIEGGDIFRITHTQDSDIWRMNLICFDSNGPTFWGIIKDVLSKSGQLSSNELIRVLESTKTQPSGYYRYKIPRFIELLYHGMNALKPHDFSWVYSGFCYQAIDQVNHVVSYANYQDTLNFFLLSEWQYEKQLITLKFKL